LNSIAISIPSTPSLTPPSRKKLILSYWVPAIAWLIAVAIFSSKNFGAQHTDTVLRQILRLFQTSITEPHYLVLHYCVRKLAHFTVYGILSGLFFRAFRGIQNCGRSWRMKWALLALAVCLAMSSADEIHQSFTPGRTGTWRDVALDMMGAGFVQMAFLFGTSGSARRRRS